MYTERSYSGSYREAMHRLQYMARQEGARVADRRHLYLALKDIDPGIFGRLLGVELIVPTEYGTINDEEGVWEGSLTLSTDLWRVVSVEGGLLETVVKECGGLANGKISRSHLAAAFLLDDADDGIHDILLSMGIENRTKEFKHGVLQRLKLMVEAKQSMKQSSADAFRATLGRVSRIKSALRETIVGQDKAIDCVASSLVDFWTRSPAERGYRPLSLFLCGDHGTGKNTFAKALSEAIAKDDFEVTITYLDGSNYAIDQDGKNLKGLDPSYKAAGPGDATTPVAAARKAILVFRNVEMMSQVGLNIVKCAMDTGYLRDGFTGEDVCFAESILIFLSAEGGDFITAEELARYGGNVTTIRQRLLEGMTEGKCGTIVSTLTAMVTHCTATIPMLPLAAGEIRVLTQRYVESGMAKLMRYTKNVRVNSDDVVGLLMQSYPDLNPRNAYSEVETGILGPIKRKFEETPGFFRRIPCHRIGSRWIGGMFGR